MSKPEFEARFIDGARGRLFLVARSAGAAARETVLVVPPFADEMNKSRHLLTEFARHAAACGLRVVLPDLYGTGESDGEFRDADWATWKADLQCVARWSELAGRPVTTILGVRLGAALAIEYACEQSAGIGKLAFWQPVLDGGRFLTQFLRLRVAAAMISPGAAETVSNLRARLKNGEFLEVAGYELSPRLAEEIDRIAPVDIGEARAGEIHWFEIVRDGMIPRATEAALIRMRSQLDAVSLRLVDGDAFWAASEIVRLPQLSAQTAEVLR